MNAKRTLHTIFRQFATGFAALSCSVVLSTAALAANIEIISLDNGTGKGLDDSRSAAPIGGNNGTTLGEQRHNVLHAAATLWAERLNLTAPIRVEASFAALPCSTSSGVLGGAGPTSVFSNFTNTPQSDTWFVVALAGNLANYDLLSVDNEPHIFMQFNGAIDNNSNCLININWYLGLDGNPSGNDIDLLTVVLHELAHGLGFTSLVSEDGSLLEDKVGNPIHDRWNTFLFDETTSQHWRDMDDGLRAASSINDGNVTWDGEAVSAQSSTLSSGVSSGRIQMYTPNPWEQGSSVAHYDQRIGPGSSLMRPYHEGADHDLDLAVALMQDIGWDIVNNNKPTPSTLMLNLYEKKKRNQKSR